jgi:hypothetical protein
MKKYVVGDDGTGQLEARGGVRLFGATSRHEYERIILKSISKGASKQKEILKFIEIAFKEKFNVTDISVINDGSPRWKKNVQWKMYLMKNDGLLKYQKKTRTWGLTEKGLKRLG